MATKIETLFTNMAKAVHSGKLTPGQIDKEVTSFVANSLLKGVFTGFGDTFETVDYDTPDFKMLSHLEKNVYWFSCAKNYHEVIELNNALRVDGKQITYAQFKEKAFAINEKFNAKNLRPEFNHAIASSQMARRWVDIQEAKGTHGCLRYETVGDDRVRLEHQALEGVTKPVDDPFWDMWYPPNGWNCRCDVVQVECSKITADDKITYPEKPNPIFQTNTAKKGMVYPDGHPYYDLLKEHEANLKKTSDKLHRKNQQNEAREILVNSKASVNRKELPSPITFNGTGVKEMFNQPHKHYNDKNSLIRVIDKVLEKAIYKGFNHYKLKHPTVANHIFETTINDEASYIIVKESNMGEFNCYSISDGDKVLEGIKKPKTKKPK